MDLKTAWGADVALGYDGLDREHGLQLQLLDALEATISAGGSREACLELVQRLLDYTDVHFGSEELLMRLHSYPRYGAHVEEHRRLLEQLDQIRSRQADGREPLDLVRELRAWVRGHIQGMDRDFAAHVMDGFGAG